MYLNKKILVSLAILITGIILASICYYSTSWATRPVGVITSNHIKDELVNKTEDSYKNNDEIRQQTMKVKVLSGKNKGKTYVVHNVYSPSQAVTYKYRPHQRVIVAFVKHKAKVMSPKRDWVLVLGFFIMLSILALLAGRHTIMLMASLVLNAVIFFFIIKFDIIENGTKTFLIYGLAVILFTFVSLLLAQGLNRKMLVTLLATLLGVFVSFGICYLIMRLTHESGIKYEAVDYATQDPRSLFLAQALLGVLGAVMDEATDIISSLHALAKHKASLTIREMILSGRTMGQEIMGPLINVLVLIFMAEALPMTILFLRDNNTLNYTFQFALSLGVIQSLISAVGIVLTIVFSTFCSIIFLKKKARR
ncbi:putative membrane protein [Lactobacillus colini]|uniref:Membrane protein n=1 Tax=Lactobacillus colini TaxID=1819254 RepID=A0ABS4MCP9_9LACO|nr:YibE/F family protein [Lactobacillus colini]MBP2057459.1 putative membrane protein [Lactobacillus colini]